MSVYYEPGTYEAIVNNHSMTFAKTGTPMIVFEVTVSGRFINEGQVDEKIAAVPNRYNRTVRMAISEKSKDMSLKKLRYAGFIGSRFEDLNMRDKAVRLKCDEDEYNGDRVERWDFVLPPLERQELPENDLNVAKKLNAMFGRTLKETAGDGAESPPASHPAPKPSEPAEAFYEDAPVTEDEVPF